MQERQRIDEDAYSARASRREATYVASLLFDKPSATGPPGCLKEEGKSYHLPCILVRTA